MSDTEWSRKITCKHDNSPQKGNPYSRYCVECKQYYYPDEVELPKPIPQMSKEEVNQELCERLGLCWHDEKWKLAARYYECSCCGKVSTSPGMNSHNNDFFSDPGKMVLLREIRNSDYWKRFCIWASAYARIMDYNSSGKVFISVDCLLDATCFVDRVLEWLRKEQG